MITFKYRTEKGRLGQVVKRPVALIEFQDVNGSWILKDFYIDSGADITLIPRSVGDLLGFELKQDETIEEIGGIAGKLPTVRRKVKIRIGKNELDTEIAWALTEEVPLLLGRKDVFDTFYITFKQDKGLIVFEPIVSWRSVKTP